MKQFLYITAGLLVFCLWQAAWAHSANVDALASEVAGKPVSVHCETNADTWRELVNQNFEPDPISNMIAGFTNLREAKVFLGPQICQALIQAERFGAVNAGLLPFSLAILTLVHETIHQRGITDENQTSCAAKKETPAIAEKYYGIKQYVFQTKLVPAFKVVRVAGKSVRVKTMASKRVRVLNPQYVALVTYIGLWHNELPEGYRKGC